VTKHFKLKEFGAENAPWEVQNNCFLLATLILEPVRAEFQLPIRVTSGWRAPDKNAAVGGVDHSQHLDGSACDFLILGMAMPVVYSYICDKLNWSGEVLYYQIRGHVHVALPQLGIQADRLILKK